MEFIATDRRRVQRKAERRKSREIVEVKEEKEEGIFFFLHIHIMSSGRQQQQ